MGADTREKRSIAAAWKRPPFASLQKSRTSLLALSLVTAAGCTEVSATSRPGTRTYVGIVQVTVPATRGKLSVTDVKAAGLGSDGGPWFGWRASSWVAADPHDCQLLIIIRSSVETAQAAKLLQSLEGANPCIVDYTRSPAPLRPERP